MSKHDGNDGRWSNDAIAKRLEKLRHRPLEMERLRGRVRSAVSASRPAARTLKRLTSFRAIAAILLIAGAIAAVLCIASGAPVPASAAELASIHRDNGSGASHGTAVDSIQSAGRVLGSQWSHCPPLPQVPSVMVASCHVHLFSGKHLACLALKVEGQIVTLAVAHAADMQMPATGQIVTRGGAKYYVQSSGGVNIVIAQRDGLWLCVMGELPVERVVDLATSLRA